MTEDEPKLTAAQIRNGWSPESVRQYLASRKESASSRLVGGFQIVVMPEGWRPKRQPEFEHAGRWSPLRHKLVR